MRGYNLQIAKKQLLLGYSVETNMQSFEAWYSILHAHTHTFTHTHTHTPLYYSELFYSNDLFFGGSQKLSPPWPQC